MHDLTRCTYATTNQETQITVYKGIYYGLSPHLIRSLSFNTEASTRNFGKSLFYLTKVTLPNLLS